MSASRTFLAAKNLSKVPSRGKALENYARPSIDELGVPTESWTKVNSANQTKFLTHLGIGAVMTGVTGYKLWSEVFGVQSACNSTPHHLLKNE